MKRRRFIGALLGGASAFALDPERALWVPGKKLISIPTNDQVHFYVLRNGRAFANLWCAAATALHDNALPVIDNRTGERFDWDACRIAENWGPSNMVTERREYNRGDIRDVMDHARSRRDRATFARNNPYPVKP